jgi:hypothetical protein
MTAPQRVKISGDLFHRQVPTCAVPVAFPSRYHNAYRAVRPRVRAVDLYREHLARNPELVERARLELAGKDLACWCPLDEPCHADVLLEIVNGGEAVAHDHHPQPGAGRVATTGATTTTGRSPAMTEYETAPSYKHDYNYDEDWDRGRLDAQDDYDVDGQKPEPIGPDNDEPFVPGEKKSRGWIDGWNYAVAHDFD